MQHASFRISAAIYEPCQATLRQQSSGLSLFSKKCRIQTFNGKAGVCKKILVLLNLPLYQDLNTRILKIRIFAFMSADCGPTSGRKLAYKRGQFLSF